MTLVRSSLAALWLLASAISAQAQTAIDGDTVEYKGVAVHLWGIDAPEKGQLCADGWNAGAAALERLTQILRTSPVVCTLKDGAGTGDRVVGVCTAGGKDIAAEMAKAGMAWAAPRETDTYTVQEAEAMEAVRGVHAHPCDKAWEWRARHRDKQ